VKEALPLILNLLSFKIKIGLKNGTWIGRHLRLSVTFYILEVFLGIYGLCVWKHMDLNSRQFIKDFKTASLFKPMANLGTLELSLLFKYIFIYHVIFYETDKM
jgi:hypothetical protein